MSLLQSARTLVESPLHAKMQSSSSPSYIFHLRKPQASAQALTARISLPSKMAEIRDEYGNPIQLTDAHGNPVQLTDEYGNPMHLTGVVTTTVDAEKRAASGKTTDGTGSNGAGGAPQRDQQQQQKQQHEDKRSSSSSSSSSEDEGHGGNGDQGGEGEQGRRRKKKGLKEKIREKLIGGKHKDDHSHTPSEHTAATTHSHFTSVHTAVTTHSPTSPGSEHHEHEKKGVMEKIKEKLPGHHSS